MKSPTKDQTFSSIVRAGRGSSYEEAVCAAAAAKRAARRQHAVLRALESKNSDSPIRRTWEILPASGSQMELAAQLKNGDAASRGAMIVAAKAHRWNFNKTSSLVLLSD
jgi:hypothetical protein